MSNSDLFQVKEDEENMKSDNDIQLPTSKDPDNYTDVAPDDQQVVDQKQDENNPEKGKLCSGKYEVPNDEEFTTPTSSDHKIPEVTTCPPAPKKLSKKRRASLSPSINPTLHVDLESTFTTIIHEDTERSIKKLRKQDGEE